MLELIWLVLALALNLAGMGWLAQAMDVHWSQVRPGAEPASAATVRALRWLGGGALFASFILCLAADHASMAALVWVMALAGAALITALSLAWRPTLLKVLAPWPAVSAASA